MVTHRTLIRSAVVAAAVLSVSFADRASRACSPPPCRPAWSAPAAGKTIPANAPALVFVQGTGSFGKPGPTTPPVLKNASGTIATTVDGVFLRPSAELPVGPVTLEWDEACGAGSVDAGYEKRDLTFTVAPAATLPTAIGTATVAYARERTPVITYAGSCTDGLDAAVAKLTFALDPALAKFRDVARLRTYVDGTLWAETAWGREGPIANPITYFMDSGARRHDTLYAACGAVPTGVSDSGLSTGKHSVEVRGELAGGAALTPIKLEIELQCGGAPPDSGVAPDAPPASADSGSDSSWDSGSSDSGCSVGRSPGAPLSLAFAALALAWVGRRRSLDTTRRDR